MGKGKRAAGQYMQKLREDSAKIYYDIPALNWGEMIDGKYVVTNRYDFKWRYTTGTTKTLANLPTDLHSYILNFKKECEKEGRSVSAYLGTDSQSHLSYTRFVICLCLRVEGNGVHVLVSKMDLPKIYDYRYRLLKETDISTEFIRNYKEYFKNIDMPLEVHGDYNSMTNHKSNGVVTEATNYLKTHGFNLKIKPSSWAASYGADYWC